MAAQARNDNVVHLAIPAAPARRKAAAKSPAQSPSTAAEYFQRIELYAHKIRQTKNIDNIIETLEEAIRSNALARLFKKDKPDILDKEFKETLVSKFDPKE